MRQRNIKTMTMREYFIGQALTGMLANPNWNEQALALSNIPQGRGADAAAIMAEMYADALLKRPRPGSKKPPDAPPAPGSR